MSYARIYKLRHYSCLDIFDIIAFSPNSTVQFLRHYSPTPFALPMKNKFDKKYCLLNNPSQQKGQLGIKQVLPKIRKTDEQIDRQVDPGKIKLKRFP